jgi:CPA2 family monovalent cation:H+ antiporter-2
MAELVLLTHLGFMVIAAAASIFVARALRQPLLLGYLLAGLIVGPAGLQLINNPEEIALLSELGIIFLLFTIGAETDFLRFLRTGPTVLLGGFAQILITILVAFLVFPSLGFEAVFYVGLALALSSTMIVVKLLHEKKLLESLPGQLMLGFLLVQDLAVVLALPILAAGAGGFTAELMQSVILKFLILAGVMVLLSKTIFPRLFRSAARTPELLYLTALATCFGFIAIAAELEISLAIGAFLAGVAIAQLPYNLEVVNSIRGLRDFFVLIFFVALGTQISFNLSTISWGLVLLLAVLVFVFKPVVLYIITQIGGYGSHASSEVSFGMAQLSEFSLILLLQAVTIGVITQNFYSVFVFVAAVSMVLTPYFMKHGPAVHSWIKGKMGFTIFSDHKVFSRRVNVLQKHPKKLANHIIVLGGGRTGKYLVDLLSKKYPMVVVDHDPVQVAFFKKKKIPVLFGSAQNPEALVNANIEKAKLLVCTLPNMEDTETIIDYVKHFFPKVKVFAKANYYEDAWNLYRKGADFVLLTEIIGGHIFSENVEKYLKTGKFMKRIDLQRLRERYLEERTSQDGLEFRL